MLDLYFLALEPAETVEAVSAGGATGDPRPHATRPPKPSVAAER
jgi:hypothetical protein